MQNQSYKFSRTNTKNVYNILKAQISMYNIYFILDENSNQIE